MTMLSIADIHSFNDEPRVLDLRLAEALGFERSRDVRNLIKRHREELNTNGPLLQFDAMVDIGSGAKRAVQEYHLNEAQALLVCMFSRTEKAAEVRRLLIEVFMAWRKGELAPQIEEKEPRIIMPGHPDFGQAVRLVREARLSRGATAALALWRNIGLPWVPELENEAVLKSEQSTDSVALFAREGLEPAPGVLTPAAMLVPAYMQFCAVRNIAPYGDASFQTRFGRMGFLRSKSTGRSVYLNIRVKPQSQEAAQ